MSKKKEFKKLMKSGEFDYQDAEIDVLLDCGRKDPCEEMTEQEDRAYDKGYANAKKVFKKTKSEKDFMTQREVALNLANQYEKLYMLVYSRSDFETRYNLELYELQGFIDGLLSIMYADA